MGQQDEQHQARRWLRAALLLGAGALAVAGGPVPAWQALRGLATVAGPQQLEVALAATATLLVSGVVGVLLAVVLLVEGAALPGRAGAVCREAALRLCPVPARHLVAAALGAAVVVSAAGPAAAVGAPPAPAADATVVLDHPWTTGAATPAGSDATPTPSPPTAAPAPAAAQTAVVVAPGDTLWSLAAGALAVQQPGRPVTNRRVAQAWPAWWAANREVVGEDPDLLLPGTRLVPPAH